MVTKVPFGSQYQLSLNSIPLSSCWPRRQYFFSVRRVYFYFCSCLFAYMAREKNKQQLLNKHVSQPSPTHDISETWSAAWVLTRRKRKRQETGKKKGMRVCSSRVCTRARMSLKIFTFFFTPSLIAALAHRICLLLSSLLSLLISFFFLIYTSCKHINISSPVRHFISRPLKFFSNDTYKLT